MDNQTIAMADQLTAAVREVFEERGYHDIEVSIAAEKDGRMHFMMNFQGKPPLNQEIVDSVLKEALVRIGATIFDED